MFNAKVVTVLGLLLMASLGLNIRQQVLLKKGDEGIAVLGVLDGDTITLEGKTRFRLRNIDAPEMDFCGGEEAKKVLEKLVTSKRVRTEEQIIDVFGRPMGLVYVDDKLVNEEMIKSGWVKYHSDKTSVSERLKAISDSNKAEDKGMFGKCWEVENKNNPECTIKGNIDPSNSQLKRYYLPGCVQYKTTIVELDRGEQWFCNEKEAKNAGYVKSERCP